MMKTIETRIPLILPSTHWTLLHDQLVNKYDIKINREDVKIKIPPADHVILWRYGRG